MQKQLDDDKWNFDHLDELLADKEVPNDVKRDLAALKEKHTDLKEELDKKKKKVDESADKLQAFDEIMGTIDDWIKSEKDSPVEPMSNDPDVLKKTLKDLEVFLFPFSL